MSASTWWIIGLVIVLGGIFVWFILPGKPPPPSEIPPMPTPPKPAKKKGPPTLEDRLAQVLQFKIVTLELLQLLKANNEFYLGFGRTLEEQRRFDFSMYRQDVIKIVEGIMQEHIETERALETRIAMGLTPGKDSNGQEETS